MTNYLKWLVTYPSAPPVSFAKAMVESYVRSYAPKGSQVKGENSNFFETKSAVRLARMEDLSNAVNRVGDLLLARPKLLGSNRASYERRAPVRPSRGHP